MRRVALFFMVLALTFITCRKDDFGTPIEDDFDAAVEALSYVFKYPDNTEPVNTSEEGLPGGICTVKTYAYAPGYAESILLDPSTDIVVPGMLIDPTSMMAGNYTILKSEKAPIVLSHSANNQHVEIETPELSTIREGIRILNDYGGVNPSNFTYEMETVNSREDLKLKLAGHYKNPWVKISAQFNWNKASVKTRAFAKFVQVYYSIDVDPKDRPSDWFEELPNISSWGGHSPVYIASVKYGRIGIMTIESEAEETRLRAGLDASFSAMGHSGGVSLDAAYNDVWEKTSIKALVIGGDPTEAAKSINGFAGFNEWILNSAAYSETSPGSPVAYSMRYLKDNTVAEVVLAGEYQIKECTALPEFVTPKRVGPFYPVAIAGDNDFKTKVCTYSVIADLFLDGEGRLALGINFLIATEGDDKTVGEYVDTLRLEAFEEQWPAGVRIQEILSDVNTRKIDEIETWDPVEVSFGDHELVKTFIIRGDTDEQDLSISKEYCSHKDCTYLEIELHPIRVIWERAGSQP